MDAINNIHDLQTGDIILFSNKKCWFSRLIEWKTQTKWSHVAMVLKDPTYINPSLQGLYIWESGAEKFGDCENNKRKISVQITDLSKIIDFNFNDNFNDKNTKHTQNIKDIKNIKKKYGYHGEVYFRRLYGNTLTENELQRRIIDIHNVVHNKSYDFELLDFLIATKESNIVNKKKKFINSKKTTKFYCSALVGYIYTQLGIISKDTNWTRCEPAFFSTDNKSIEFLGNYQLGDELRIM